MMKATLTHIGAVSLGRLLAVWSFVIGLLCLVLWGLVTLLLSLIGLAAGADVVSLIVGLVISFAVGVIGLFVFAIFMFVFGVITATIYNIILGVGGGIDIDLKERP